MTVAVESSISFSVGVLVGVGPFKVIHVSGGTSRVSSIGGNFSCSPWFLRALVNIVSDILCHGMGTIGRATSGRSAKVSSFAAFLGAVRKSCFRRRAPHFSFSRVNWVRASFSVSFGVVVSRSFGSQCSFVHIHCWYASGAPVFSDTVMVLACSFSWCCLTWVWVIFMCEANQLSVSLRRSVDIGNFHFHFLCVFIHRSRLY